MATDIKKLVSELTLEEKASLLGGKDFWHTKAVERLGIPAVMVSDGPHGLRKQGPEGGPPGRERVYQGGLLPGRLCDGGFL